MPLKSQHYLSDTGKDFKRGCSWGSEENFGKDTYGRYGRKDRGLYASGTDHRSGVAFMEGLHVDAMWA